MIITSPPDSRKREREKKKLLSILGGARAAQAAQSVASTCFFVCLGLELPYLSVCAQRLVSFVAATDTHLERERERDLFSHKFGFGALSRESCKL